MGYYLFAILNNIRCTLVVLAVIFFIISVVKTLNYSDHYDDEQKARKTFFKGLVITASIIFIHAFIPSQKQMAFIISAPYIFENQDIKNASQNTSEIIKLGTEYLKEILYEKTNAIKNERN